MKVAVISPNTHNLRDMSAVLTGMSHQVVAVEGGKTKMRTIAEANAPDLMIVEGMCCDPEELSQVEYLSTRWPNMAVVLVCATHTPEFLLHSMRVGVREVLPSPANADALAAMVIRIDAKRSGSTGAGVGKILAFLPCKGGSGATFLATNLAWQLSERASVLLIDLNLQFGDALATLHDGKPPSSIVDLSRAADRLDASMLAAATVSISPTYSILAAPEDPAQSVDIRPDHLDAILATAVTAYDFVVLDMGRTLDPLSIRALDKAHRIFPVLQQSLPAVRHASRLVSAFHSLGYPDQKIEPIVNRFDKSSPIGLDELTRSLGNLEFRTVPNSYKEVNAAIEQGAALAKMARSNLVTRRLAEFASSMQPKPSGDRGNLLSRFLKRA